VNTSPAPPHLTFPDKKFAPLFAQIFFHFYLLG